jgi:hypothetical protein
VPLPAPDVDVVKVTHETGLCAVQLHEPPAVTLTLPVPAVAATDALAGEIA